MASLFTLTSLGAGVLAGNNPKTYIEEYVLYKKGDKSTNVEDAIESLSPYKQKTLMDDLEKHNKSLEDIEVITTAFQYTKKDSEGNELSINEDDVQIIKKKIDHHKTKYEKGLKHKNATAVGDNLFGNLFETNKASAYTTEYYDGIELSTWAVNYSVGTNYDVRYKLFGSFDWYWDNDGKSHTYDPHIDGDDFMTLNWAGDLALETQKYAEVKVQEYPWNDPVTYTNSNYYIDQHDVELNGGLAWRFDEMYHISGAYYAKATQGHMYVYVHKNTSTGEDGNFKFTYTHTWKEAEIGLSVSAGSGGTSGSVNISYPDKTKNFVTYELVRM